MFYLYLVSITVLCLLVFKQAPLYFLQHFCFILQNSLSTLQIYQKTVSKAFCFKSSECRVWVTATCLSDQNPCFLISCLQLIGFFFVLYSMSFPGKPYGIMSVLNMNLIYSSMTVQTGTEVQQESVHRKQPKLLTFITRETTTNF